MKKFAAESQTYKISKHYDQGVSPRYNKRTMMNKAYKAFLKGEKYYTYKRETFIVPATQSQIEWK